MIKRYCNFSTFVFQVLYSITHKKKKEKKVVYVYTAMSGSPFYLSLIVFYQAF